MRHQLIRQLFQTVLIFSTLVKCTTDSQSVDFAAIFDESGVTGTFVLQELYSGKMQIYNEKRSTQPYIPASTFKILNSLIALESGAISDTNEIIKWDGTVRSIEQWNRDHNLSSAIKVSAVWFYQELARRIGAEKMQHFVDKSAYGNKNIGGELDSFWLRGDLRISAIEQISFLKKFYQEDLPFSSENFKKVKEILVVERGQDYVLRAKTGWGGQGKSEIGWYVGYLEKQDEVYLFALNIDIYKNDEAKARAGIARKVLQARGLLPE